MPEEQNIAVLEQARSAWNSGDLAGYLRVYAPEAAALEGDPPSEEAPVRAFYQAFFDAFPGSQLIFEDVFAAGDKVVCRFIIYGAHGEPFQGIPATGKDVALPGITILRFEDGVCVERWSQVDFLGLLTQLGVLGSPLK